MASRAVSLGAISYQSTGVLMNKFTSAKLAIVAAVVAVASIPAHAALDAAVTTAITTAQTDLLALLSALTAAGVVVWVARLIYARFRVK